MESLENDDDLGTLQRRLSALPAGLQELYACMISSIEPFYRDTAARTIQIVGLANMPLSPLAMYFADEDPAQALSDEKLLTQQDIEARHVTVAKRLKTRTAGLIEINSAARETSIGDSGSERSISDSTASAQKAKLREPGKVQYLHLTVKEFFSSGSLPNWVSSPSIDTITDCHRRNAASCLRQLQAVQSHSLHSYSQGRSASPGIGVGQYWLSMSGGILFMILHHCLQAERLGRASQLEVLEKLDHVITTAKPQLYDNSSSYDISVKLDEPIKWHWTYGRYGDWSEPQGWQSDYVAFLVTIGMIRSVIAKFRSGYDAAEKPGWPLLLYATCSLAPDYAITDMERDTIDPFLVAELLRRKCDLN